MKVIPQTPKVGDIIEYTQEKNILARYLVLNVSDVTHESGQTVDDIWTLTLLTVYGKDPSKPINEVFDLSLSHKDFFGFYWDNKLFRFRILCSTEPENLCCSGDIQD